MRRLFQFCLLFPFFSAAPARGQVISLSVKDAPLEKVFQLVEQQSKFIFIYSSEQVAKARPVTLTVYREELRAVLDRCFAGQPLAYSISDRHIVVKEKAGPYERPLSGKVINEEGLPVAGVTVLIQGGSLSIATDTDGNFSFATVAPHAILFFSGAEIETIAVNSGTGVFVTVQVKAKLGTLDEAYAIAYGKATRRLATGTVTSIRKQDIEKQPVSNPLSALAGTVAGLQISPLSGAPGAQWNIRLRGQNSIASGNEPLIIVDGIPYPYSNINTFTGGGVPSSPLAIFNPSDIERIEVLKDADATAIYGSRGANGVILINTKRPQEGTTRLQVRSYAGMGRIARYPELLHTSEYLVMRREAFQNDGLIPTAVNAPDLLLWDTSRYTDWPRKLLGNSMHLYDTRLDLSGGNPLTQFLFTAAYHAESTVLPSREPGEKKISASIHVTHKTGNSRLHLGFSATFLKNNTMLPQPDMTNLVLLPPTAPSLYRNNLLNWENSTWVNPFSYLLKTYRSEAENLLTTITVSYRLVKGLEFKAAFGYTSLRVEDQVANPGISFDPSLSSSATAGFGDNGSSTLILEPQLSYHRKSGKTEINLLAGSSIQSSAQEGLSQLGVGYDSDALLGSLSAASSVYTVSETDIRYRYLGFFARVTAQFNGKYVLSLNARRDGSSRYGPANRFANFGSAGLAWLFSRESFFSKLKWLSHGKFKMSGGWTGNDQIGDFNYIDLYSASTFNYQGLTTFQPQQLFNPTYSWEKVKKFDLGLDLGIFKDRLLAAINFYYAITGNQLLPYALPSNTGFNSVLKNVDARIENSGWELEISSIPIQSRHWKWTSCFNLTVPRNRLVRFPDLALSVYANTYIPGKPLSISKRYQSSGVDPLTGLYTFVDFDSDGRISSPNDQQSIVFTGQQYYGGLQNSISWKRYNLSFLLQYVRQKNVPSFLSQSGKPGIAGNQPRLVLNRWQQPGDIASIQRFSNSAGEAYLAFSNYRSSDAAFANASFLRLRNLYLSMETGKGGRKRSTTASSQVFVQAQHVFTITKYPGFDPETKSLMPPLRIITAGFQMNF